MAFPNEFTPGKSIELKVGQINDMIEEWVFISPWDGWIKIPETGGYCKIVLARRGDRQALESGDAVRAMTASILAETSKQTTPQQPLTEKLRKKILEEQAQRFGLSPKESDQAIRAWKKKAKDPYDIGVAALYERHYRQATEKLTESLRLREKKRLNLGRV